MTTPNATAPPRVRFRGRLVSQGRLDRETRMDLLRNFRTRARLAHPAALATWRASVDAPCGVRETMRAIARELWDESDSLRRLAASTAHGPLSYTSFKRALVAIASSRRCA